MDLLKTYHKIQLLTRFSSHFRKAAHPVCTKSQKALLIYKEYPKGLHHCRLLRNGE